MDDDGLASEKFSSVDVFFGSRANYVLSQFVKRYLEGIKLKDLKTEITIEKQRAESLSNSALW